MSEAILFLWLLVAVVVVAELLLLPLGSCHAFNNIRARQLSRKSAST